MTARVELIAHTTEPARVVAAAAKLCYSPATASGLFEGLDAGKVRDFLGKLRAVGHLSPFEHASFTFAIDGVSRVMTHQLVRHRIASYSQQSQRYVTMGSPRTVMPPEVAANPEAREIFERTAAEAHAAYEKIAALGVPKEDARFILPHGWETSLVMTMNARELYHFFAIRICRRAQWEIRRVAARMFALVREAAPELFERSGPACLSEGACREMHPCGRPYKDEREILEFALEKDHE